MPKSKSSRRWLQEHFTDPYVKQAKQEGYRSRAAFKLIELHERDRLFKPGMTIVDLGAAPGGWSQLVAKWIKPKGQLFALDILPMDPIDDVTFLQGDFTESSVLETLLQKMGGAKADWVLSDMAPNMSGNESIDIPRIIYLGELAFDLALQVLRPGGGFLIKLFQGEGFDNFLAEIKSKFKTVSIRKPKASRDRSREVYILARDFKQK